jgi:poly-gamma-glutamate synthesis protein (capsule biosynthesis protein)
LTGGFAGSTGEYRLEGVTLLDGERKLYVASSGLSMREGPGTGFKICGSLMNEVEVTVTGISNDNWVKLKTYPNTALNGDCTGTDFFVNSGYLTDAPERDETSSTTSNSLREVTFSRACEPIANRTKVVIGFVGDVLPHKPLQKQALANSKQFSIHWKNVASKLAEPDFTYANFEGPSAPGLEISSYPTFNYPEFLPDNLKAVGIDVVSTANNHFFDKGVKGIDQTIVNLDDSNLSHFGTKSSNASDTGFYHISEIKGTNGNIRIAWVACTFSNNFSSSPSVDPKHQAMYCFNQNGGGGGNNTALLALVADLSSRADVDATIVTPHWGEEGVHRPHSRQSSLARALVEAGATAVIGAHPHVIQPWEKIVSGGREVLVHYSLGNFISNQPSAPQRASMILYLGLVKDENGKVYTDGVKYLPMYMTQARDSSNRLGYHTLIPLDGSAAPDSIGKAAQANIFSLLPEKYRVKIDQPVSTNGIQCHL